MTEEPPFRVLTRSVLAHCRVSLKTRIRWDLGARPAYLLGLGTAALQAAQQGIPSIGAIEFGVAAGNGLCILQEEARRIEQETGVQIRVYGFDRGRGLPEATGDYRDHPDYWQAGDFPMDVPKLQARLESRRTTLILGDLRDTVRQFVHQQREPVGFIALDVDLYSSASDALRLLAHPRVAMLKQTCLYLDDLVPFYGHRFAGELLAVEEFNRASSRVKIDRWLGVRYDRPFPERPYLDNMFVAHDLAAISATALRRETRHLSLSRR